jgi:hypothetical protein
MVILGLSVIKLMFTGWAKASLLMKLLIDLIEVSIGSSAFEKLKESSTFCTYY